MSESHDIEHWPKLGVGVALFKGKKILLGKRINAHGGDTWSLPGGHVDPFESPQEAAARELLEETSIRVKAKHIIAGPWVNVIFEKERKHYVTFFMCALAPEEAIALVLEEDKCEMWCWFDLDNLPTPLFLPIEQLLTEDKQALYKCLDAMDQA